MKATPKFNASVAAWLFTTLIVGVPGLAQGQDETLDGPVPDTRARAAVKILAETPPDELRLAQAASPTVAVTPEKFMFHVSDRAQRGRVQPSKLRAPGVLPELPAGVPEEPADPLVGSPQEPRAGS